MVNESNTNRSNLGLQAQLFWALVDKPHGDIEPSGYKNEVLGLIFLKHISDAFEAKRAELITDDLADAEDPKEYLAGNVFWVPKEARWCHLQAESTTTMIGKRLDNAMLAIEACNASLEGMLPNDYSRPELNTVKLGRFIDILGKISIASAADRFRDVFGRVYEDFLCKIAMFEGYRGGEFFTPRSVVRLLVEMLKPHKGPRLRSLLRLWRNVGRVH